MRTKGSRGLRGGHVGWGWCRVGGQRGSHVGGTRRHGGHVLTHPTLQAAAPHRQCSSLHSIKRLAAHGPTHQGRAARVLCKRCSPLHGIKRLAAHGPTHPMRCRWHAMQAAPIPNRGHQEVGSRKGGAQMQATARGHPAHSSPSTLGEELSTYAGGGSIPALSTLSQMNSPKHTQNGGISMDT